MAQRLLVSIHGPAETSLDDTVEPVPFEPDTFCEPSGAADILLEFTFESPSDKADALCGRPRSVLDFLGMTAETLVALSISSSTKKQTTRNPFLSEIGLGPSPVEAG